MRKIFIASVLSLLLVALGAPAIAAAQGNSAGDQYEENVPNPGGEGNGGNGGGDNGGGGDSLPPGVAEDLAEQGEDGAAAAALAEQGPDAQGSDGRGSGSDADDSDQGRGENEAGGVAGSAGSDYSSGSGGSPVGEVAQAATGTDGDDGGTGILLPIIIGLALLGGVAYLILGRRGGGAPDPV